MLDALTAAVEAGIIDSDTWVTNVFASKKIFKQFLEDLHDWSDTERFHDRWALAVLGITGDDYDQYVVTGREAAETLSADPRTLRSSAYVGGQSWSFLLHYLLHKVV